MTQQTTDVTVSTSSSLVGIRPHSPAAVAWVEENVETEGYQWMGPILWGGHRQMWVIVEAMKNDGLVVQ